MPVFRRRQPGFAAVPTRRRRIQSDRQFTCHWNGPDLLIVGLNGKGRYTSPKGWTLPSETEYPSHMSPWCLMAAPLHGHAGDSNSSALEALARTYAEFRDCGRLKPTRRPFQRGGGVAPTAATVEMRAYSVFTRFKARHASNNSRCPKPARLSFAQSLRRRFRSTRRSTLHRG
jgi:hypothetical protein